MGETIALSIKLNTNASFSAAGHGAMVGAVIRDVSGGVILYGTKRNTHMFLFLYKLSCEGFCLVWSSQDNISSLARTLKGLFNLVALISKLRVGSSFCEWGGLNLIANILTLAKECVVSSFIFIRRRANRFAHELRKLFLAGKESSVWLYFVLSNFCNPDCL